MKLWNTVKNLSKNLSLKDGWKSVSLEKNTRSGYLIGLKTNDSNIKSITFKVGIDSGAKDLILTIGNFTLNFDSITADTEEDNKSTALFRYSNYPSSFYYKIATITYNDFSSTSNLEDLKAKGVDKLDIALNIIED